MIKKLISEGKIPLTLIVGKLNEIIDEVEKLKKDVNWLKPPKLKRFRRDVYD